MFKMTGTIEYIVMLNYYINLAIFFFVCGCDLYDLSLLNQVLAVKRIEVVQMELLEGEQEFLDLVSTMSDLTHPNICILQGYCMDPGHHALLYDYAQNGSLYSALFSKNGDSQKPLSWKLRLRIALGVAHALEYVLFNYEFIF